MIEINWETINLLCNSRVAFVTAKDAMIRFKVAWKCDNPLHSHKVQFNEAKETVIFPIDIFLQQSPFEPSYPKDFRGSYEVDLVSMVWRPGPFKVRKPRFVQQKRGHF